MFKLAILTLICLASASLVFGQNLCLGLVEDDTSENGKLIRKAVQLAVNNFDKSTPVCPGFVPSNGPLAATINQIAKVTGDSFGFDFFDDSARPRTCSSPVTCQSRSWVGPADENTLASIIPFVDYNKEMIVDERNFVDRSGNPSVEIRMRSNLAEEVQVLTDLSIKTFGAQSISYVLDVKYLSLARQLSSYILLPNEKSDMDMALRAALTTSTGVGPATTSFTKFDVFIVIVNKELALPVMTVIKSLGMLTKNKKWIFASSSQLSDLSSQLTALEVPSDVVLAFDLPALTASPALDRIKGSLGPASANRSVCLAYDATTVLLQVMRKKSTIEYQNKNLTEILSSISFDGLTGTISFSSYGNRKMQNEILMEWNGNSMEIIGQFNTSSRSITLQRSVSSNKVLKVGFLMDLVSPTTSLILGLVPYSLVEYFFEKLNNQSFVPGYQVKALMKDSLLNPSLTTEMTYSLINEGIVAAIGGTLSTQAVQQGLVLGKYKTPFGVFSAGTDTLSDRTNYPTLVRVKPVDSLQSQAMVGVIHSLGWRKKVAAIGVANDYGLNGLNGLVAAAKQYDMSILTLQVFISGLSVTSQMAALKASGARCILLFSANGQDNINVLNEAYAQGMLSPQYVWMSADSLGNFRQFDWTNQPFYKHFTGTFNVAVSSIRLKPVERLINECRTLDPVKYKGLGPNYTPISTFDFLLWDLMTLMTNTFRSMALRGENIYNTTLLTNNMQASELQGLTGYISFDSKLNRKYAQYSLLNWVDGVPYEVGLFDTLSRNLTIQQELLVFPDGTSNIPDLDADTREIEFVEPSDAEGIVFYIIASILIFLVFGILVFVIIHKDNRIIKASNFSFNVLILIGIIIGFGNIYTFGAEPSKFVCNLRPWIAILSFTLIFGSLFVKTIKIWRVFYQAEELQTPAKVTNSSLVVSETIIFLLFAIVVIVWESVDPFTITEFGENFDNNKRVKMCTTENSIIYICVLFALAGVIMVMGTFVTFKVRNAQFQNMDMGDAKSIGMSIYNFVLSSIITIPIVIVLRKSPTIQYIILCLGIISAISGTCLFLFIPKIVKILKGQDLSRTKSQMSTGNSNQSNH